MRTRILALIVLTAAAAVVAVGGAASSASTRQPVVVTKTGWGTASAGPHAGFYGFGVKLVNRSKRDAIGIRVSVNPQGERSSFPQVFWAVGIPAGKSFVFGANHHNSHIGATHLTRVTATVHVLAMARRGDHPTLGRLEVSDIQIDRKNYAVNAVITDPGIYALNMKRGRAYAVLYNSAGRIIGGGFVPLWPGGPSHLKPGAHEQVSISVDGHMSRVAHVQVSATR